MLGRKNKQARQDAEAMAVAALGFLAGEPERLARFLALTGIGPSDLRQLAATPEFLSAVLTYLASDESALLTFAAGAGHDPQAIVTAEALLRQDS